MSRAGIEAIEANDIDFLGLNEGLQKSGHDLGMIILDEECAHRRIVRSEIDTRDRNPCDTAAAQSQRSNTHQTRSAPGQANSERPAVIAGIVSIPGRKKIERRQGRPVLNRLLELSPLIGN